MLLVQSLQAAFISFKFSVGTIVPSVFPLLSVPTISHSAQQSDSFYLNCASRQLKAWKEKTKPDY